MSLFQDIVLMSPRRKQDRNGFVSVPAVITRVGVQQYREDQLGLGLKGDRLVNVFRPPETVFHRDTVESFKHLPVTDGHPAEGVNPQNARYVQGGHLGEDVAQLGDAELGVTLYLTDSAFINKSKGSQTSAGYDATIIKDSGVFNGQPYEYKFDGPMIGNHLALVPAARCGSECRVLDEGNKKEKEMEASEVKALIDQAIQDNNAARTKVVSDAISTALKQHQDALDAKAQKAQQDAADKAAAEAAKQQKTQQDEAALQARVELHTKLKPLLGDKYDAKKSDKDLLVLAFGSQIQDAESKSEQYLLALLDQEVDRRAKAGVKLGDAVLSGDAVVVPAVIV